MLGVGRLDAKKDFATLIRAFARVAATHASARLVILGEGPERGRLEALAAGLGVAARVSLPGYVADPTPWYARARVFALASRHEGLSLVILEALAHRLPVVATDCPHGPAEALAGGRFGRLVPVGDVPALAAGIGAALGEAGPAGPELAAHLAAFAPATIAAEYVDLVGGLIGPPPAPR